MRLVSKLESYTLKSYRYQHTHLPFLSVSWTLYCTKESTKVQTLGATCTNKCKGVTSKYHYLVYSPTHKLHLGLLQLLCLINEVNIKVHAKHIKAYHLHLGF